MFLLLAGCATVQPAREQTAPVGSGVISTLYVIGDSTAAAYPHERYPLTGWAQVLPYYFDTSRIHLEDRARSGRSSKSYWDEGAWTPIREALQPGDFVFIQFGHNDEKKDDPNRYTDPATTYPEYLKRYVDDTRAAGAQPVLLTPVNRNAWTSPRELKDSHGAYPAAVRSLARREGVPLIDLHALTRRYYERLGPMRAARLFMNLKPGQYPNYPGGKKDNTHLQDRGAYAISALAVQAIRRQRLPLRTYLARARPTPGLGRLAPAI